MSHELIGWSGQLDLSEEPRVLLSNPRRKIDPVYAYAELAWYLSRDPMARGFMTAYAPKYEMFVQPDGKAYGAYGARIAYNVPGKDLLDEAMNVLSMTPNSRQCVISLWKPSDLITARDGWARDLPCTLTWQFFIRDGSLHMVVSMRSNDIWLGMPYDVFVNTCIMALVANTLKLKLGTYTHHVGSLHLYERNANAAREAVLRRDTYSAYVTSLDEDDMSTVEDYLTLERLMRTDVINLRSQLEEHTAYKQLGSMLRMGIDVLGGKWLRNK